MKNLAKLTALTLTAALALTACGSTADSAAPAESTADTAATEETGGDLLSQIQANGTITVAMEGTWAPWTRSWVWSRSSSRASGTACWPVWMRAVMISW